MRYECDVLVIGGGGAAIRAAVEAAKNGVSVILVDKGSFARSGTSPLSLHGFATTLHEQSSEKMLTEDILRTGSYVNDFDLVRTAVNESSKEPALLEEMGVRFVHLPDGSYDIYRGAGHSVPHGLTFDDAGNCINFVAVLGKEAWKRGVKLVEEVMITDLLVEDSRVLGAVGVDKEGNTSVFTANSIVLAAGGANGIYNNVVPRIKDPMFRTTGDGYILALGAGVPLVDMEFANFRDTPPAARLQGRYINAKGEAIMTKYDPERLEKAPRGLVVEALFREMMAGNAPIHIEITQESERIAQFMPEEYKSYVRVYKEGKRPPVTITFQRLLGGARINPDASCSVEGLFIAGENTGGFHGGDRLQGAAFLETQVFGRLAGTGAVEFARGHARRDVPEELVKKAFNRVTQILDRREGLPAETIINEIQQLTWKYASIVKDAEGLNLAIEQIKGIIEKLNQKAVGRYVFEVLEGYNLALTAEAVMRASLLRDETRGTHRRSDFTQKREDIARKHTSIHFDDTGNMVAEFVPCRD